MNYDSKDIKIADEFQWDDDKVIDFVNWYLKVKNLDFRYSLENQYIIDSFKNGDPPEAWTVNNVKKAFHKKSL